MTFAIGNSTPDIKQIKNTNETLDLPIQEGDSFKADVKNVNQNSLTLGFMKDGVERSISVETQLSSEFKVNDAVNVKVLVYSKDELKLSISRVEDESVDSGMQSALSLNADQKSSPTSPKINIDDLKKIIIETNNPMQYSKQLDQHIESAIAQVETMLTSFSDEDLTALLNENYDVGKMTVDLLYQVGHSPRIDKKIALVGDKQYEMAITVNEDAIKKLIQESSEEHFLKQVPEEQLKSTMALMLEKGIEPNTRNIEKVIRFTEKIDRIQNIDQRELIQFLASDKESTIGELNKSLYISNGKSKKDVLSERDYAAIKEDVDAIIEEHFAEQPEKIDAMKESAKEIVIKGLALDERALAVMSFTQKEMSFEEKAQFGIDQILKGDKPEAYAITLEQQKQLLSKEDLKKAIAVLHEATPETVEAVMEDKKPLTLSNLAVKLQESKQMLSKISAVEISTAEISAVEISKAEIPVLPPSVSKEVENLEVLRYQMTFKAAMRLNIEGVDIAHTQLEELRTRIEQFTTQTYRAQTDTTQVNDSRPNTGSYETTVLEMNRYFALINGASTASIGNIALEQSETDSIASIANKIERGIDRYDQLRTMPRADLGDRIEKAFSNVDAILEDLSLEVTVYNQRAVEILGRNEMAITPDSIETVKVLDIQLQELMNRMTPEHIKSLLDQQIDLLTEPIDRLTTSIIELDGDFTTTIKDSIEKSLYQFLKKEDLTQEIKNSLFGVYRMLNTIENSKGAAIGFLSERGLPMTLESLFEASQYIRSTKYTDHKIESSIDDDFGTLVQVNKTGLSIKEQIRSGYYEKSQNLESLIQRVLEGKADSLEPDTYTSQTAKVLEQIKAEVDTSDLQQLKRVLQGMTAKDKTLLREGAQFEREMERPMKIGEWQALQTMEKDPFAFKTLAEDLYRRIETIDPLKDKFEAALKELYDDPSQDGKNRFEEAVKVILAEGKEQVVNLKTESDTQNQIQRHENLAESSKPYTHLEKEIENQLSVQRQLMKQDYFQMPLMINGQMQQMNMYFFGRENTSSETEEAMSIYFSFSTQNLGTANIRVELNEDTIDVTLFSTGGNQNLRAFEPQFRSVFESIGFNVNRMRYDTFNVPKAINKDQGISQSKQIKKYQESRFESMI